MKRSELSNSFQEIYSAYVRYGRKSVIFFCVVVIGVSIYTFFAPREYRSEGKLFLRIGRENVTLDPTATLGQNPIMPMQFSRENEINSVVQLIQNRSLIEKVVCALGADVVLGKAMPAGKSDEKLAEAATLADPDVQKAILTMSKSLEVEAGKKSNVIEIAYKGSSPEQCQAVVAKVIDIYLDEHLKLNRVSGSYDFLVNQTDRLKTDLSTKEAEMRDLKNRSGLSSPAVQRDLLVARVGRIEDDLLQTETKQSVSEAKVRSLRERFAKLPPTMVTTETSGLGNDGTDRMREQLFALQVKENESAAKLTDEHPRMQQLREQVAASKAALGNEERERKQIQREPNPIYQQTQTLLLDEEATFASLQAHSTRLSTQLVAIRKDLSVLNESEMRLASLQRDIDLLEIDYKKYSANLEQSRINQQLENQRISNISVAQPASYEPKAVRPKAFLNLLFGFGLGMFGGLALPLVLVRFESLWLAPDEPDGHFDAAVSQVISRFTMKMPDGNGNGKSKDAGLASNPAAQGHGYVFK